MALGNPLTIPAVIDYIFEANFDASVAETIRKFDLPIERLEEFLELINAVLDNTITLQDIPALIEQAFGVNEARAKAITIDLTGKTLLPLAIYLPDIEKGIVDLGGNIADYPAARVVKERKENLVILKDLVIGLGFELNDVVSKRFLFLLGQFVKGEKTEEALKTYCTRSLNIGGLGLTEEQATALLQITLPQAANLVEQPKPLVSAAVSSAPVPVAVPAQTPKQALEVAPSHELAAEVPLANHPVVAIPPVPPMPKSVIKAPEGMKTATKVKPITFKPADPDLDPNELKAPAKKAAVARKLTEGIQDSFATALVTATEAVTPVLKKNKISEKVFADLADKAIRGLRDIYQTRDIVERDWELKGQDLATLMQAVTLGIEAYQSVPKPAIGQGRAQPRPANDEVKELDKRFTKLTEVEADGVIEPVRAQLTVGSTALTTSDGQRKMVDVIRPLRLAGPIEQLGKMTPTEFRRLSSNAADAGQKVQDLLVALESTAYEERVKGVLAWRASPINQLYLHIAEEALVQGLALPEVSSRRRSAGQDSLSPGEMKALALLNAQIRF